MKATFDIDFQRGASEVKHFYKHNTQKRIWQRELVWLVSTLSAFKCKLSNISRDCARKDSCAWGSHGGREVRASVGRVYKYSSTKWVGKDSVEIFYPLEHDCQSFLQFANTSDLSHNHHQPNHPRSKRDSKRSLPTSCNLLRKSQKSSKHIWTQGFIFVWIFYEVPDQ